MNSLNLLNNTELIVHYQNTHDTKAFGEIYTRFNEKVYLYCVKLLKSRDQALDLTQEIFIKLTDKVNYLNNPQAFTSWLFRIAHNLCMDYFRDQQKAHGFSKNADLLYGSIADLDAATIKETRLEQLEYILDILPDLDREILIGKYFENKSVKELMEKYDLSCSAIKMRLVRSRKKVKQLFTELDCSVPVFAC